MFCISLFVLFLSCPYYLSFQLQLLITPLALLHRLVCFSYFSIFKCFIGHFFSICPSYFGLIYCIRWLTASDYPFGGTFKRFLLSVSMVFKLFRMILGCPVRLPYEIRLCSSLSFVFFKMFFFIRNPIVLLLCFFAYTFFYILMNILFCRLSLRISV